MPECKQCTFLNPSDAIVCEVCFARIALPKRCKNGDGSGGDNSVSAATSTSRQPSKYNLFMKTEIARIKQSQPELAHKEAFKQAAKNWRAEAASDGGSSSSHQQSGKSDGKSEQRKEETSEAAEETLESGKFRVCPACTFANPMKRTTCCVCQTRLPRREASQLVHREASGSSTPAEPEVAAAAEGRACQSCTFLNLWSATTCALCHAKLPKGREREKAAEDAAAAKRAQEEAARQELAYRALPKATMEREGYRYHDVGDFPRGWSELVASAAAAAEELLAEDAQAERAERRLETINSHRRQLRFVPDGFSSNDVPNPQRYVALTERSQSILEVARALKARLGPEMADWVAQDLYVLHTPREEEGSKARAPQSWHLDSIKQFAVAALVLRGGHPTEFPTGPYSDFSAGVDTPKLESWMKFWRGDGFETDPGREAESVEEHEHFTRHLHAAQLTTDAYACDWTQLEVAPAPKAAPGFATTFWSNKVHRGPATAKGEERLVLFCTWLPPSMVRASESETDYSYKACHLEPKLRLSDAASQAAALEYAAGERRTRKAT